MAGKGENLLCEKDVAQMLNVSVRTVQRARLDGDGPKWLRIRKLIRYRQGDVLDFITEKMVTA